MTEVITIPVNKLHEKKSILAGKRVTDVTIVPGLCNKYTVETAPIVKTGRLGRSGRQRVRAIVPPKPVRGRLGRAGNPYPSPVNKPKTSSKKRK